MQPRFVRVCAVALAPLIVVVALHDRTSIVSTRGQPDVFFLLLLSLTRAGPHVPTSRSLIRSPARCRYDPLHVPLLGGMATINSDPSTLFFCSLSQLPGPQRHVLQVGSPSLFFMPAFHLPVSLFPASLLLPARGLFPCPTHNVIFNFSPHLRK